MNGSGTTGRGRSGKMAKRVIAWILAAGFVFLVANILFIGLYRGLSALIYILIVLTFLFTLKK